MSIILLVAGVFVVVAVLMQHGKSQGLSGTIAGGTETYFGKEKSKRWDKTLSRLTTVVGACFVLVVLVMYVLMPDPKFSSVHTKNGQTISPSYSTAADATEKTASEES